MKACFFGASVTRQADSYVHALGDLMPGDAFAAFGHGGMQFIDAGICFLDEALETDAETHFLDWFSATRAYDEAKLTACLDAVCHRLIARGRTPAFLLLPRRDINPLRVANYATVRAYAERHAMRVVDIDALVRAEGVPLEKLLSDNVHTTRDGSEYYAAAIRDALGTPAPLPRQPPPNKYVRIESTALEKTVEQCLEIEVEDEVVGMLQTIGPFSGQVIIHREGRPPRSVEVWDAWCHYERPQLAIPIVGPGTFVVEVSQETIEKGHCRRPIDDWSVFGPNKLVLKTIFHVGGCRIVRAV